MNYREWIMDWFEKHTSASRKELEENKEQNYFDMGYIDSFEFIELVSEIEELGLELHNDQFEDRDFATISGLIKILEKIEK